MMEHEAGSDYSGNPNTWNVTLITSMDRLFKDITNIASYTVHPDISNWDVSQVTTMYYMFSNARSFNNDIAQWNVSQVTNMSLMFQNAFVFNQDIGQWNVSQVTNMSSMFEGAGDFNQDISGWNVTQVTNMLFMFLGASNFNQNINRWAVGSGTTLTSMFNEFRHNHIGEWDVSVPTPLYTQFNQKYKPTTYSNLQGALSLWYTKANAGSAGATELAEANNYNGTGTGSDYYGNPNTWDVTAVTDMENLFKDISNIGSMVMFIQI